MARILVTGSSDGLGLAAARLMIHDGHAVVLHARNAARASVAEAAAPGAAGSVGAAHRTAFSINCWTTGL